MDVDIIYDKDCIEGLREMPDESIDTCITSPPYFNLRNYGASGQIGQEKTPAEYINKLVDVFTEVHRVLKKSGTLWVVIADTYSSVKYDNGVKPKDLIGIPWMLALALRTKGWYLRQDIIWSKQNPMPQSIKDRCTTSHEYIFMLSKSQKYYFDQDAIMEDAAYDGRKDTRMKGSHKYSQGATGIRKQTFAARAHDRWKIRDGKYIRNKRSVWNVNTRPFKGSHFAVFPELLIVDCVKAGCPVGGIVLDPFMGAGTTAIVAKSLDRHYIGFDINWEYVDIANKRIKNLDYEI